MTLLSELAAKDKWKEENISYNKLDGPKIRNYHPIHD